MSLFRAQTDRFCSEEEESDDYPFPLTLKPKKSSASSSGAVSPALNGTS